MLRTITLALTTAVGLLRAPSSAHACHTPYVPVFQRFDDATAVAEVEVRSVRGPRARLDVRRVLKGAGATTLVMTGISGKSCSPRVRRGRDALVFLAADGRVRDYHGYVEDFSRWSALLGTWAAATDDDARARVVIDAIVGTDEIVTGDAAAFLIEQPGLLAVLDAAQKKQIAAAAIATAPGTLLPLVLSRLHDEETIAALPTGVLATDVQIMDHARALAASIAFETVTDPAALGDAITAGSGDRDPNRIAAFDRCERVWGRHLFSFTRYVGGVDEARWTALADACRTGVPSPVFLK